MGAWCVTNTVLLPRPQRFDPRRHQLCHHFHHLFPLNRVNVWYSGYLELIITAHVHFIYFFVHHQGAFDFGESLQCDPTRLRLKNWCTAVAMTAEKTLPRLRSHFSRTPSSHWMLYVPCRTALMQISCYSAWRTNSDECFPLRMATRTLPSSRWTVSISASRDTPPWLQLCGVTWWVWRDELCSSRLSHQRVAG